MPTYGINEKTKTSPDFLLGKINDKTPPGIGDARPEIRIRFAGGKDKRQLLAIFRPRITKKW